MFTFLVVVWLGMETEIVAIEEVIDYFSKNPKLWTEDPAHKPFKTYNVTVG